METNNTTAKIIFYPVGNGDTTQIITTSNERIIIDFNCVALEKGKFDLSKEIKKDLDGKTEVEVFMVTHMDNDHMCGFSDFFELEHAQKYQGNDRVKIKELWVPAAVILETGEEIDGEKAILRAEARHRLQEGKGIKIFSKPEDLKDYLLKNNIPSRSDLFVSAGQSLTMFQNLTIFCHTPFYDDTDKNHIERNKCSIITHYTFNTGEKQIKYLHIGDTEYQNIERLVQKSKSETLEWDIFNIPHHCSYKALSNEKIGEGGKTSPTSLVKKLLLSGRRGAYMISSSNPIENTAQDQPPHIEAKRCYEDYLTQINGYQLLVTMEYPNKNNPEPIILEIGSKGTKLKLKEMPDFPKRPTLITGYEDTRYA